MARAEEPVGDSPNDAVVEVPQTFSRSPDARPGYMGRSFSYANSAFVLSLNGARHVEVAAICHSERSRDSGGGEESQLSW